jgi:hypothetical protein
MDYPNIQPGKDEFNENEQPLPSENIDQITFQQIEYLIQQQVKIPHKFK